MVMGEGKKHNLKEHHHHHNHHDHIDDVMKESDEHEQQQQQQQPCSSIEEASTISNGSSSLSCSSCSSFEDTRDDASSSSANSSRSSLYDLTDLMSHLPIKRGLSKFYHGKSDSFTSLAKVTSIEDLPKKENNPHKKKIKKTFKSHTLPKPLISKKNSRKKKFGSNIKEL